MEEFAKNLITNGMSRINVANNLGVSIQMIDRWVLEEPEIFAEITEMKSDEI